MNTPDNPSDRSPARPVSFVEALLFWLKLGFISFGGPAGQIAIMHQELVERRRWISERRFLHALNYCMVLPGPEAQHTLTQMSWFFTKAARVTFGGAYAVLPYVYQGAVTEFGWLKMLFGPSIFFSPALRPQRW